MRRSFATIFLASLLSLSAAANDCGVLLTGTSDDLPAHEQFYRLITSYIAVVPTAQKIVPEILKAKNPINPFANPRTTAEMQMKLAMVDLVKAMSPEEWSKAQVLFGGQNKVAKKQKVDRKKRSEETEIIRRLEIKFKDQKEHLGNVPTPSAITIGERTFVAQAHDHRIQIYELNLETAQLEQRVNMNGPGLVTGTPQFLLSKSGEVYLATLGQSHIHLYAYDLQNHLKDVQHLDSPFAGTLVKTDVNDGRIAIWVFDGAIPDGRKDSVSLFEFDQEKARLAAKGIQPSFSYKTVELIKQTDDELLFLTGQQKPVIYTVKRSDFTFLNSWTKNLTIETAPYSARIGNSGLVVGGHPESVELWDFFNKGDYNVASAEVDSDHAYNAPFDVVKIGARTVIVSAIDGGLTVTEITNGGTNLKIQHLYDSNFFDGSGTRYSQVLGEVDDKVLLLYTDITAGQIELVEMDKKTLVIRHVDSLSGNFRDKPFVVRTKKQIYVVGPAYDGNLFVMTVLGTIQ